MSERVVTPLAQVRKGIAAGIAVISLAAGLSKAEANPVSDAPASVEFSTITHGSISEHTILHSDNSIVAEVASADGTEGVLPAKKAPGMIITRSLDNPSNPQPIDPSNLTIPPNVTKIMEKYTGYVPSLGCSAFVLYNKQDVAVGAETAQHCDMLPADGYVRNIDGQNYMFTPSNDPITVYTGNTLRDLKVAGNVEQVVISSEPNMTMINPNQGANTDTDVALLVFNGHSYQEVMQLYNDMRLKPKQIAELKKGETIYNSGWPVNNLNPSTIDSKARRFVGEYIGRTVNGENTGANIDAVEIAISSTKDGAECSWGNSGSAAFIVGKDGKPKIVGTASDFIDLSNKVQVIGVSGVQKEKKKLEKTFNVALSSNTAAVCSFGYQTPSSYDRIVASTINIYDVYNTVSAQPLADALKQQVRVTDNIQTINGIVKVQLPGNTAFAVENPVYSFDQASQTLIMGWEGVDDQGKPSFQYASFAGNIGLSFLSIIPESDSMPILGETAGPLTSGYGGESYINPNGNIVGMYRKSMPYENGYTLSEANGSLVLTPPKVVSPPNVGK